MQKCLGIYVEENLIKYAKVSKEKDDIKIESFGIRFYQDLAEDIKKIVEETYSFNNPISINLANENYLYFDIFALLNKKDIEISVKTEFESYCEEKNLNSNAFETRYALMPNKYDDEKVRALNIAINKIELNRQEEPFKGYKDDIALHPKVPHDNFKSFPSGHTAETSIVLVGVVFLQRVAVLQQRLEELLPERWQVARDELSEDLDFRLHVSLRVTAGEERKSRCLETVLGDGL